METLAPSPAVNRLRAGSRSLVTGPSMAPSPDSPTLVRQLASLPRPAPRERNIMAVAQTIARWWPPRATRKTACSRRVTAGLTPAAVPALGRVSQRLGLLAIAVGGWLVAESARAEPSRERELILVLQTNAPEADQALACKGLAEHGTAAAVPALARLLDHERLASWALIALEAIPDPACDAALREAIGRLQGRELIGAINSIGVRRDADAASLLAPKLQVGDRAVVSAAAAALGKIGTPEAASILKAVFTASADSGSRLAAAGPLIICAERLTEAGRRTEALEIYDLVRQAEVPEARLREGIRGAILLRDEAGVSLLAEQLRSLEPFRFRLGLSTARELPSPLVDDMVISQLAEATPARAVLLIELLADRGNPRAIPTLTRATNDPRLGVPLAAARGLGRLGTVAELDPLLQMARGKDGERAAAAVEAIAALQDPGVDGEIGRRLTTADRSDQPLLLSVVAKRRIPDLPAVAALAASTDPAVRSAALIALGETVGLDQLDLLLAAVVAPQGEATTDAARAALRAAAVRLPEQDACVAKLLAASQRAAIETKVTLLEVIAAVAGKEALQAVAAAARGEEPALQDAATRLLGEWLSVDAGPVLLDLAQQLPDGKFRSRAFRGYLRIARQFGGNPGEKVAMCRQAMQAARTVDERRAVLEAVQTVPSRGAIKLVLETAGEADLQDASRAAARTILTAIGDRDPQAWQLAAPLGLEPPAATKR